jgi:hypothetical protein
MAVWYPLGREHLVNLLVGRARIFVYYIGHTNVRAGVFGPVGFSAQTTRVAHVQRDRHKAEVKLVLEESAKPEKGAEKPPNNS